MALLIEDRATDCVPLTNDRLAVGFRVEHDVRVPRQTIGAGPYLVVDRVVNRHHRGGHQLFSRSHPGSRPRKRWA